MIKISENIFALLEQSKKLSTENPQESMKLSQSALKIAKENNLKREEGYALIYMAYACRVECDFVKGLKYSFDAINIFSEINDIEGIIRAHNIIGIIYFYFGSYSQAIEHMFKSLSILKNTDYHFLKSCVIANIGEIYREAGDNEDAMKNYMEALEISNLYGFYENKAAIMLNIGKVYSGMDKHCEALDFLCKCKNILMESKDFVTLGEVENEIGKVMFKQGHIDVARQHYFEALKKLNNVKNKYYIIDVLINIGILGDETSKSLVEYFNLALKYSEEIHSNIKISMSYKCLSDYYASENDYKLALEFFKKYHYKQQEMEASNMVKSLEIKKLEFEYSKEKNEIENLKSIRSSMENEIASSLEKVENLKKINDKLKKESILDELTGIYNRRGLNEKLETLLTNHRKANGYCVIFIMDIDCFKKFNDYWGHLKGDKCIIDICKCISNIKRKNSLFARYGGEEFVYISMVEDFNDAYILGEEMRRKVEDLFIKYNEEPECNVVTISVGGVYTPVPLYESFDDLMKMADLQLYNAKNNGRNKVCLIKD
ncbi:hypothetical protein GCM10008905_23980 [Clostridium malenominatum]|uniref:GGDEF domain-containing protein n=1 Tax=Clostridium malenominatum TaxID=1539 RepID=A0ABN1J2P1_9CLOT